MLHKARLTAADVEAHEGFAVTRPLRTLRDVADDPGLPDEQLEQAIADALARGMVRASALKLELTQAMSPAVATGWPR